MARALTFHPHPGFRVPGYVNAHHDAARIAKEAALRGMAEDAYVEALLAYQWPDGKPAFTVAPHAPEAVVAAAAAAAPPEEPKPRKP